MGVISSEHTDLGAYALGLLEDQDKAAFESHLATCDACRAELAALARVAGLLKDMKPGEPGTGPADRPGPVTE